MARAAVLEHRRVPLFAASMGIVDYTSRLAADVLKTAYRPRSSESRLYFGVVWGLVAIGVVIVLVGLDQPLVLLVISAFSRAFFGVLSAITMSARWAIWSSGPRDRSGG